MLIGHRIQPKQTEEGTGKRGEITIGIIIAAINCGQGMLYS